MADAHVKEPVCVKQPAFVLGQLHCLYSRSFIRTQHPTSMRCSLVLALFFAGYSSTAEGRVVSVLGDEVPVEIFPAAGARLVV